LTFKKRLHILKHRYRGKKMAPAFNAFHTFLFSPDETTHTGSHIRAADDLKRTMNTVIMALIPVLLFSFFNTGYQHYSAINGFPENFSVMEHFLTWDNFWLGFVLVIPLVIVSYGVGLLIEFIFAVIKGHEVEEGYLVTGMLVPLIVPVDTPLWMLAVAVVFGVIIGKEVFGGTGMNILNPALTARAFLFFAYPSEMSGVKVWIEGLKEGKGIIDGFSGETILAQAASGNTGFVNGAGDAYTTSDMFLGFIPGSVGETSTLAILLGAAILLYTGVGSWKIMFSVFAGGYLMGLILNLFAVNPFMAIPAGQHLIIGGFAFGAVFMATDPVTAAQTGKGKFIYGFLTGILAILIRVLNPAYPEGMMLAILLMNVFAPLIDHYVIEANIKKRLKRVKMGT